jgi:hypothetical protein
MTFGFQGCSSGEPLEFQQSMAKRLPTIKSTYTAAATSAAKDSGSSDKNSRSNISSQ